MATNIKGYKCYIKKPEKYLSSFEPVFKFCQGTKIHIGLTCKKYNRSKELIRRWALIWVYKLKNKKHRTLHEEEILRQNIQFLQVTHCMRVLKAVQKSQLTEL